MPMGSRYSSAARAARAQPRYTQEEMELARQLADGRKEESKGWFDWRISSRRSTKRSMKRSMKRSKRSKRRSMKRSKRRSTKRSKRSKRRSMKRSKRRSMKRRY